MNTSQDLERVLRQLYDLFKAVPNPPYPRDLARVHYIMQRLGSPHAKFPAVIVTGSKGKGSTSTFLAALLQASGLRVGLFTGPHLHSYRERIRINDDEISVQDFIDVHDEVRRAIQTDPEHTYVSRFEMLTAIGLTYFAQHKIDIAVLEVGMGGRFDAVNVALRSPLAVFTPIELEHVMPLGPAVKDIVYHKTGVMRAGGMAVTAAQSLHVSELLYWATQKMGVPLRHSRDYWQYQAGSLQVQLVANKFWQDFEVRQPNGQIHSIRSGLAGTFQVQNATTALTAAQILASQGYMSEPDPAALQNAVIPGRLEVIGRDPLVIADGAHTPNAIRELLQSLAVLGGTPIWVLGFLDGKLITQMLELLPLENSTVFLCNIDFYRTAALETIQKSLKHTPAHLEIGLSLEDALVSAKRAAAAIPGGYVCVTGSLHLVADARVCMGVLEPALRAEAELLSEIESEPVVLIQY